MKVLVRLFILTAPFLLFGARAALAATGGVAALDTFFTTVEGVMSGPVAGLIVLVILIAAAGMLAVARNFEHGFQVLLAGGAGAALLAGAATVIPVLWPTAGALIS